MTLERWEYLRKTVTESLATVPDTVEWFPIL
jgi:hypothetical protein